MEKNFMSMKREELIDFIYEKKRELKDEVTIFAHNFTADDLIPFADVVGDSSKLTNATIESKSKYLLFTAAKFFTEVACILVPDRTIIQANLQASCPLTDMIDEIATKTAFDTIKNNSVEKELIPMAYFTASYKLKSFCGEHNGTVCTASNSVKLIDHYLKLNKAIFFTPMDNIAYNAIKTLKLSDDDYFVLDHNTPLDSIPGDKKMYIWDVGCYIHSDFSIHNIKDTREKYKDDDIKIVAHLECMPDVIAECDYGHFTDGMHDLIRNSPSGSCWGVATTNNFVERMANRYPDKKIVAVRPDLICDGMVITDLPHLADSLQSIIDHKKGIGELKHKMEIPEHHRKYAKKAIETMFEINKQKNIVDEVVNF